jgi:outer membrane biosynthesis protein TonB
MARASTQIDSLRPSRFEMERLGLALALSLMLHLLTWGGYEAGKKFGWWQQWHWPVWMHHAKKFAVIPPPVVRTEEPLTFVTVDNPSTEAPKNAKYYSSQNSRAANPDAMQEVKDPKLNGKQTDVPKTEDVARTDFSKLQPSAPSPPQPQQLAMNMGDLTLGKPQDSQQDQKPQPPRPRTLNQARRMAGMQMQQNGGVQRQARSALDVKATGFGEYDAALVEAITQHWYDLLDSQQFAQDRSGKVVLQFRLNYDGSITDMNVAQSNVGELLSYVCQKAVTDPAPFAKWPSDMRAKLGNFRDIQFTFYYY